MNAVSECFRSVADVWIVWAACIVALIVTTRSATIRLKSLCWRRLHADERGASYTVALSLIIPFYMVVLATIIESTQILVVKMGTVYAAYSAARSAIVWVPANPRLAIGKIDAAAAQAMTPFAANHPRYLAASGGFGATDPAGDESYYKAYRQYAGATSGPWAPPDYLARKREYAQRATTVIPHDDLFARGAPTDADVRLTVRYEMPLDVPAVGRFLGHRSPWAGAAFFTRTIESAVTLQKEGVQSDNPDRLKLGIVYDSDN